jgi:hypothetical protein
MDHVSCYHYSILRIEFQNLKIYLIQSHCSISLPQKPSCTKHSIPLQSVNYPSDPNSSKCQLQFITQSLPVPEEVRLCFLRQQLLNN